MAKQLLKSKKTTTPKEKKKRKETLLVKYGVIAFIEILAFISAFFAKNSSFNSL